MKIIKIQESKRGHKKLEIVASFTIKEAKILKRLINDGNKILKLRTPMKPDGIMVKRKGAWISLKKVFGALKLNYPNQG